LLCSESGESCSMGAPFAGRWLVELQSSHGCGRPPYPSSRRRAHGAIDARRQLVNQQVIRGCADEISQ
jgi:hypothetical protein